MFDNDNLPKKYLVPLGLQHAFAMFGATILVPLLTGLSTSVALFTAGTGTLLYVLITKGKVPSFLGSSFAFIVPIITVSQTYGVEYAYGGIISMGVFYVIISFLIRFLGTRWISRALPAVVIGSVIVVIGLNLAPTAINMAMYKDGEYSLVYTSIAIVTLTAAIVPTIAFKGFFSVIPVLIALVVGYTFTYVTGMFSEAYNIINMATVAEASWITFPKFATVKFDFIASLSFVIVSLATMCEHLGDVLVTSKIVGRDLYKDPGLKRTLLGNGVASIWAALFGGPPNTTYGENVAVMAITGVYSVKVIVIAAIFATCLSFMNKFSGIIQTIPTPVLGGISMMLFGVIASTGLRTFVESKVDFRDKKNLIIASVIMVIGIGGGRFSFPINGDVHFNLTGIALASLVGILLNIVLPNSKENERELYKEGEEQKSIIDNPDINNK